MKAYSAWSFPGAAMQCALCIFGVGVLILFPSSIGATDPSPTRGVPPPVGAPPARPTQSARPANTDQALGVLPMPQPRRDIRSVPGTNPLPAPIPRASPPPVVASLWLPPIYTSWQIQFTTPVDLSIDAQMYDIDLFSNDANVVAALHTRGRHVACYFSAGTWEPQRPDSNRFPASVKGNSYGGAFAQERWLDIRRLDVLGPLMQARMDLCKQKGFETIETDNVDGFINATGFPITAQDQLAYNRWLATQAHARGLSIGLKNDAEQVPDLVNIFDWSLVEQCFDYNECARYSPFVAVGKAVFVIEYTIDSGQFCAQTNALNFNGLYKNLALDAFRIPCR